MGHVPYGDAVEVRCYNMIRVDRFLSETHT